MSAKLLIVDDDPDIRKTLSFLLDSSAVILEAASGFDALRIIKEEKPALMLLDNVMPIMSGFEVLRRAKEIDAKLQVVMLTSEDDIEIAKQALELGAAQYITKPFDAEDLRKMVARLLAPEPETD